MKPAGFALAFNTVLTAACLAQMTPTYVVNIPMRDGKTLAADVYVPAACTSCPAILIQTPYNKNNFRNGLPLGFQQNLQSSPYAWVVVDWRGFYGSASAAVSNPNRGQDGYDVIGWIAVQSWCSGKVGTWGPSALGGIQYSTARENHPSHTCAVPQVAHPHQAYDDYFYGGVLEKARLQTLDALGYGLSPVIMANTYYSAVWQFSENSSWYPQDIRIPTLQIGGWYDHNIDKMTDWYAATRSSSDTSVRDEQWLLVGPWVHGGTGAAYVGSPNQGELTYANAAYVSDAMALDFFAWYLLDSANNWPATPLITYYELGKDTWSSSAATTIEIANTDALYLNPGNVLSTQNGSGWSAFVSDPRNPSPTLGGHTLSLGLSQGPYDQRPLEGRPDILAFSTGSLFAGVTVSGRVKLSLYVECDRPDADIAVRLVDVYPDGRNMLVNDGIRRMRFRNGYTKADETFLTTGQVYNVEVELPFVNYTWKTGHALKVFIGGNSSTRWDVNIQDGDTMYLAGDTAVADIRIHHDATYPGRIILPGNNPALAAGEIPASSPVAVFPNPAGDVLFLRNSKSCGPYEITDLSGRTVARAAACGNGIDVSGLEGGLYFLKLFSGNPVAVHKFVKH